MQSLKVLLVEDEPLIAIDLEDKMVESGMVVVRTASGKDAVEHVLREPPDVMVLDLGLPDISGLDVLRILTTKEVQIPTIILTGLKNRELRHEVRMHGVCAYLEKPFEPQMLIARIRLVFGSDGESVPPNLLARIRTALKAEPGTENST